MATAAAPPLPGMGEATILNKNNNQTKLSPNFSKYIASLQDELVATKTKDDQDGFTAFLSNSQALHPNEVKEKLNSVDNSNLLDKISNYLTTPDAALEATLPDPDLSLPMNNYYVSSSHNTYLTGNQLSSVSSVDSYIIVLKKGCRCVEIDVWDGKPTEETTDSEDDEKRGLRDRLGLKLSKSRTNDTDSSNQGHRLGLRQKLGLKSKDTGPEAPPEEISESKDGAAESSELPTPWRAPGELRVEPRVLHGHTLTKEVSFRRVCESIRATAFATSDMPIVVSLEVHAGLEQQDIMVDIMRQVWRDHLVDPNPSAGSTGEPSSLPSPDQLRKKILIKVKYTPPEQAKQQQKADNEGSGSENEDEVHAGDQKKQGKKKKMSEALSDMGIYTRAYHFKSFDQPEAKLPSHIFALSEGGLGKAISENPSALFAHNQKYFMRAYPKGTRLTSSNLNPSPLWRYGVQMVALNWQKCDKSIMLNQGMFSNTGGWVLKPPRWRATAPVPSPSALPGSAQPDDKTGAPGKQPTEATTKLLNLTLTVFAGQDLPVPKVVETSGALRPYVKAILHAEEPVKLSTSGDTDYEAPSKLDSARAFLHRHKSGTPSTGASSKPKLKARTTAANGTNPDFGAQKLTFTRVPVDEEQLSFLRIKVQDDREMREDELVAWACVRLDRVQVGWRVLGLWDAHGNRCDGKILMRVEKSLVNETAAGSRKAADNLPLPMR